MINRTQITLLSLRFKAETTEDFAHEDEELDERLEHVSHAASRGTGGVRFDAQLPPSLPPFLPLSPLHSLCKCNRRITRDKARGAAT